MSTKLRSPFRDATAARHGYRRADAPRPDLLQGDWRVTFLGNEALLDLHAKARKLLGIGKLYGLRFDGLRATHLLGNPKRKLSEAKPADLDLGASAIDGRPCVVMTSDPANGALWSQLRTELRMLDDDTLIGVDLVGPPRVTIPLPFVLHRHNGKALS